MQVGNGFSEGVAQVASFMHLLSFLFRWFLVSREYAWSHPYIAINYIVLVNDIG